MARGSKRFLSQLQGQMNQNTPIPYGGNMAFMNTGRAKRNPNRAFGALSKLMTKMPADQRKQLAANLGSIFNVEGSGLGGRGRIQDAVNNLSDIKLMYEGSQSDKEQGMNAIGQVLANAGLTGPGWKQAPAPQSFMGGTQYTPNINPPPGSPGLDPDAAGMPIGGGAGNQLNLGAAQGGAMGLAAPAPATLAQTVNTMGNATPATTTPVAPAGNTGGLPAVPGTGAATGGTATGGTAGPGTATGTPASGQTATATGGNIGSMGASSANTSPTMASAAPAGVGATSNSLINTGPLSAPGVGLNQIQSTVNNSAALSNNPINSQQMFQQQFNPMINMAGQVDIQNQLATPGRSFVAGQYGQGGMANIMGQQQANEAALAGGQAAQQAIGTNLQHQMQGQQAQSQMDLAARQQAVQQANALLGPALSGAASGFQQGLGGMTRGAQFLS